MNSKFEKNRIEEIVCFIIAILLVVWMLTSCCPYTRHVAPSVQDSISVVVRHQTVFIPDTLRLALPDESRLQVLRDSSHLETSLAISDARVNADGTLTHTLHNKKEKQNIPYERPVEYKDSIVYRDTEITKIVEVEKELTWWQTTQIKGFYLMSFIVLGMAIWKIIKIKLHQK